MPQRPPRRHLVILSVAVLTVLAAALFLFRGQPAPSLAAHGLTLRCLSQAAWPRDDGEGLAVRGDRTAELAVESRERLYALRFDFERRAPASLEVEGGRVTGRTLRPDGSVAFQVALGEGRKVRPWWRPWAPRYRYRLRFTLPGAPPEPVALDVSVAATVVEGGDG